MRCSTDWRRAAPTCCSKGGTSLSKGFDLIERFSEDIDITVFRDDLGVGASVEELEAMSGKKRRSSLDAIRALPVRNSSAVPLRVRLEGLAQELTGQAPAHPVRSQRSGRAEPVAPISRHHRYRRQLHQPGRQNRSGCEISARSACAGGNRALYRRRSDRVRSHGRERHHGRSGPDILGQGDYSAWPAPLVRAPW